MMKNGKRMLGILLAAALTAAVSPVASGRADAALTDQSEKLAAGPGSMSGPGRAADADDSNQPAAGPGNVSGPGRAADNGADPARTDGAGSAREKAENAADSAEETAEVNIRMVGDDLIHGIIYRTYQQPDGSYNFDPLFDNMRTEIQAADVAIINQETIMVNDPALVSDYPCFGTPEEIGHSLISAGFDVIAHATNHTMDRGAAAVFSTINFWKTNYPDITYLGIHDTPEDSEIRYLTSKGIRIGFVNYTYGLNGIRRPAGLEYCVDLLTDGGIEATMQEARANCDLLIAILHVGDEYVYQPTPYEQQQVNRFIDLGADIVLCSHPHVLEPYGMVTTANGRTGLVYYSLGNYVSAQTRIPRVLGGMADITVRKTAGEEGAVEIVSYDLVPLVTHSQGAFVTTFRLDQYPDELALRHNFTGAGLTKQGLWDLYYSIMNGTAR